MDRSSLNDMLIMGREGRWFAVVPRHGALAGERGGNRWREGPQA
jgi:hypothetical protein